MRKPKKTSMKLSGETGAVRPDVYTRITDIMLAQLEEGVRPWVQPWSAARLAGCVSRPLRFNGEPYSGINVLLLWSEAASRCFGASTWMTFRQALELGGNVRKGETGTMVVYANRIRKTETDANGDDVEHEIPFLKAYTVFNLEQIEGLPAGFWRIAADAGLQACRASRACRRLFPGNGGNDPPWWCGSLLGARAGCDPDAADRGVSRCRELLCDARP